MKKAEDKITIALTEHGARTLYDLYKLEGLMQDLDPFTYSDISDYATLKTRALLNLQEAIDEVFGGALEAYDTIINREFQVYDDTVEDVLSDDAITEEHLDILIESGIIVKLSVDEDAFENLIFSHLSNLGFNDPHNPINYDATIDDILAWWKPFIEMYIAFYPKKAKKMVDMEYTPDMDLFREILVDLQFIQTRAKKATQNIDLIKAIHGPQTHNID